MKNSSFSLLSYSTPPPATALPAPPFRRRPFFLHLLSPSPLFSPSSLFSSPHRRRYHCGSATAADPPPPPSCRGSGFAALLRQSGRLRKTVDRCSLPPHLSLFSPLFTVAPPSSSFVGPGSPPPPRMHGLRLRRPPPGGPPSISKDTETVAVGARVVVGWRRSVKLTAGIRQVHKDKYSSLF
ncbi:proline-rich receptor-like protein kinase PERK2 [Salvia splendens]|uniref:proline-rich receptor-like protein kinase PERK2 n=1 Tax=Salvia splendens TaxID=180675 RepID=UPI001C255504|nr:proline-rich receptor-like protein kinase PERK2 [Salvia splendens]